MNQYYDPYGRRRSVQPARRQAGGPTLEDYRSLAAAYQELQAQVANLEQELANRDKAVAVRNDELAELKRKLEIKDEALTRQTADIKEMEAELVWANAAVQKQESDEEKDASEEETWRERYTRLQADVENMRKRWEQRFENETAEARHQILRDMLPLADHLEMALQHAHGHPDEMNQDFVRNIEATLQAFVDTLTRYGVTRLDAMGKPFDPNVHEAVGQVNTGEGEPGTVAHVVQTGYSEGDKLLRPARVLVKQ